MLLAREDLTPEQIEAFRELAETSFGNPDEEFIYATMPEVDPDTVAPEIWAHAERFWKNGQYYDWQRYQIKSGDTLSGIAQRTLGNVGYDYYMWIANHNGIPNANYIVTGNWIDIPVYHPNYEWEQEQERLRREAELRQRQEEEARIRREQEEAFAREQERVRQEAEARQREVEAQQKQLEEQERRLREEMERRRQEEERLKEEARLRELERQAEITRQQGKGGLDWFIAKSLPEFGPVDPFETRLTGETVGNLVPDDYYRFTLSRNGRITAELKQLLADADLVLYDVRNHPISYSMRDGITDEQLIADLIPGTYMLRVNSPKGVTTDYELIVKFQHLLSATQKGPPPGWRVGGGNGGNSGSSSSSGGGSAGQIFADPRIKRIYDTALNNFVIPERAKANTQIQQLEREKQSYEQELQQLLDQMNGEQRAKVHRALDGIRDERRAWVDSVANTIKNGIDNTADEIIKQIESKIPSQAYDLPWLGDQLRSAKDSFKGAVNSARSWLNAKVDGVKNGVKDAISQFTEALKNAYRTGGEINSAIETAAQELKQKIDNLVGSINNLVSEYKGKILDSVQWLRNVGVNIPDIKDFWGHTLIPGFKWNFYDSVVEPLANSLANGIKSSVTSVGDFAKGTVDWIKPRAQSAVAAVVDAIFGDKTGTLYNKIHGVDQQIEATKTGLERAITNAGNRILGVARQIETLLTDPEERNRVLAALSQHGYKTAEEALNFVRETLPKIRLEMINDIVISRKTEVSLIGQRPIILLAGAVVYSVQPTKLTHEFSAKVGPHLGLELVTDHQLNAEKINIAAEKKLNNGFVQGLEVDSEGNVTFSFGGSIFKIKGSLDVKNHEIALSGANSVNEITIIEDPKVSLSGEQSLQIAGKVEAYTLQPVFVLTEEAVRVALKKFQETNSAFRELTDSGIDYLTEVFSNPDFWVGVGWGLVGAGAILAIAFAPEIIAAGAFVAASIAASFTDLAVLVEFLLTLGILKLQ